MTTIKHGKACKYKYVGIDKFFAPFCYYDDKLEVAKKHGFNCWYDFIREAWAQYESSIQVSRLTGMTESSVRFMIKKFGFKHRGPGKIWPVRFKKQER